MKDSIQHIQRDAMDKAKHAKSLHPVQWFGSSYENTRKYKKQKTKQKQKTNTKKNTKMSRNNLEMTFMNILYKH